MNIDYNLLGKRIALLRKGKGITQAQLAEKADITNNFLSHIERSYSIPSLETLIKICDALDVTPDTVLLGAKTDKKEYMGNEIYEKISSCSSKQKRFIIDIIDALQKESLE